MEDREGGGDEKSGGMAVAAGTPNILNIDSKLFTTVRGEGAARPVQRCAVVSKRVGCYGLVSNQARICVKRVW